MISVVLAAVALFAAGEPAAATAATTQAPAKGEKADKDGMVCKREAVLGSRMKQRVCMTQAEWDARKMSDRDNLEEAQRNKPLNSN